MQAIPTYSMATFKVPLRVCKKMDGLVKKFRWGSKARSNRYLAMLAWKDLYKPKEVERLGFRCFKDINMSLLSKLIWKMARHEDSLWVCLLRTKYMKSQTFFEHTLKKGSSKIWQPIIMAKRELREGVCFKVGSGHSINPLTDPWIQSLPGGTPKLKASLVDGIPHRVAELYGAYG